MKYSYLLIILLVSFLLTSCDSNDNNDDYDNNQNYNYNDVLIDSETENLNETKRISYNDLINRK